MEVRSNITELLQTETAVGFARARGCFEGTLVMAVITPRASSNNVLVLDHVRRMDFLELEAAFEVECLFGVADQRGCTHDVDPALADVILTVDEHWITPHASAPSVIAEMSGSMSWSTPLLKSP